MNRRRFLKTGAAAATLISCDGIWYTFVSASLIDNGDTAYSSWSNWTEDAEPKPLKLVRAAILAASPHNTQPWKFRVADSFIEFYVETSRSVCGLDPYLREAHIGLGCALENLALAASANGYGAKVTLTSGKLDSRVAGPPLQLVARVEMSPAHPQASELYDSIPKRHTNRSLYDRRMELPPAFATELSDVCKVDEKVRLLLFTDEAQQKELTKISSSANSELYSDPEVENGSDAWIRWRSADVQRFKDGLTIDTFGLSPFTAAMAKMMPTWMLKQAASPSRRAGLYAKQMQSARVIGIIAVRDRMDKPQCLQAGRLWQRAHLLATARGVGARPCNEAVEMIDHERVLGRPAKRLSELSEVIGDPAWQPTFLFLMGSPTLPAHASPRRPIQSLEI